jgi:hypothetical protein
MQGLFGKPKKTEDQRLVVMTQVLESKRTTKFHTNTMFNTNDTAKFQAHSRPLLSTGLKLICLKAHDIDGILSKSG